MMTSQQAIQIPLRGTGWPLVLGIALLLTACGPDANNTTSTSAIPESATNTESASITTPSATEANSAVQIAAAPAKTAPDQEATSALLKQREEHQREIAKSKSAFTGFQFNDRYRESGITFRHRITEDSGKYWKPVHYDHGSGVAVADVDGDGWLDVYFVSHLGSNGLWRNRGDGTFEDITEKAGVAVGDRVCVAAAFADVDNDGDPDLFVTAVREGNVLFENMGNGTFRDRSADSGLEYKGHSSGAVFWDYDRDGLLDLFVANVGVYTHDFKAYGGAYRGMDDGFHGHLFPARFETSRLYKNLGALKFQDVTEKTGIAFDGWSGDASICDLNQDGWLDLYVLNMQGDDAFFENQNGQSFVDKTETYFPKTPWGAMGIKFFDADQDGDFDLYLTDMHSDMTDQQTSDGLTDLGASFEKAKSEAWCSIEWSDEFLLGPDNNIFGNAFYLNQGNGSFQEISGQNGSETYWPWGMSVGDLNADGFEDAFVAAGMGASFRYGINSVLINEGGTGFFDAEFLVGVEPRMDGRTHKTGYVLDCDGEDKDHPGCEGITGRARVVESLSSRASAIFDWDHDGDLDIMTNEMNDRPMVLVNNLSEVKELRYIKLKLVGSKSPRDAIGAVVKLTTSKRTYTQIHDGKSGYLGFSQIPLYFALAPEENLQTIQITWPSGTKQTLAEPMGLNSMIEIQETP